MRRRRLLLVSTLWLVPAVMLAQPGRSATFQPAGSAAADGEPVMLAFKFKPGAVTRWRLLLNADLQIPLGAEVPGGLPVGINADALATRKVTAVSPTGEGTVTTTVTSGKMTYSTAGFEIVIKSINGKLSASQNGQPIPAGQLGGQAEAIVPPPLNGKPLTQRVSSRGAILPGAAPSNGPAATVGIDPGAVFSGNFALLPDHPVRVGETWEDSATDPGGAAPLRSRGTLKSIITKNGHRIATIETAGEVGAAGGRTFTVTTQFDATDGQAVSTNLEIVLPPKAAPAGDGGRPPAARLAAQDPAALAMLATGKVKMSITALAPAPPRKPPSAR